jgi:hypothetical protein
LASRRLDAGSTEATGVSSCESRSPDEAPETGRRESRSPYSSSSTLIPLRRCNSAWRSWVFK